MTSLAVKFATSSTEHTGRGTDRNRERERGQQAARGRRRGRAGQPAAAGGASGRTPAAGASRLGSGSTLSVRPSSPSAGVAAGVSRTPGVGGLDAPPAHAHRGTSNARHPLGPSASAPPGKGDSTRPGRDTGGDRGKLCSWGVMGTGLGWPSGVTRPPNPESHAGSGPHSQWTDWPERPRGQLTPLGRGLMGSDPRDRWQEACGGVGRSRARVIAEAPRGTQRRPEPWHSPGGGRGGSGSSSGELGPRTPGQRQCPEAGALTHESQPSHPGLSLAKLTDFSPKQATEREGQPGPADDGDRPPDAAGVGWPCRGDQGFPEAYSRVSVQFPVPPPVGSADGWAGWGGRLPGPPRCPPAHGGPRPPVTGRSGSRRPLRPQPKPVLIAVFREPTLALPTPQPPPPALQAPPAADGETEAPEWGLSPPLGLSTGPGGPGRSHTGGLRAAVAGVCGQAGRRTAGRGAGAGGRPSLP